MCVMGVEENNRFLAGLTSTSDALLCTQAIGKNRNKGDHLLKIAAPFFAKYGAIVQFM